MPLALADVLSPVPAPPEILAEPLAEPARGALVMMLMIPKKAFSP